MPLSKARMRERKMVDRQNVKPNFQNVKPNYALHPNAYLLGHLSVCPDYDVNNPGDHYEHCLYVNPMLREGENNGSNR